MPYRISRRQFSLMAAGSLFPVSAGRRALAADAATATVTEGVTIIADGGITAAIVVPDKPVNSVWYAAQELAWHLQRAAAPSRVAIVREGRHDATGATRSTVYLGRTRFADANGLSEIALDPEACVIRSIGADLCIVGRDHNGDPLDEDISAGTLFGVYEILATLLNVRWLWPGDAGAYVPATRNWVIAPIDRHVEPPLMMRHVRFGAKMKSAAHPELGFTPGATKDYWHAQAVYMRRHRLGKRYRMSYGHAFTKWWKQYGEEHPEWFQLVDGRRGPRKAGRRYSMSIADPGLHKEIVARWQREGGARDKGVPSIINACENDIPGLCQCALCRALDGPEPAGYRKFIPPRSKIADLPYVTDRYARSWLAIQQLAARENPNATVVGYAYFNYFAAPSPGVKLNENVLIGFCPSSWSYPRSSAEQEWIKKQWRGWAETDAGIFMRTNYFLDGYCMPFIFAHQFADEFHNAATHRLVGTDLDSLTGQWSVQGPTLYLMMRLHMQPDADAEDILDEYYSGFGAAADAVKAYFAYWEDYTQEQLDRIDTVFLNRSASRWKSFAKAADAVYPETCFVEAEKRLDAAAAAVDGDEDAAARVEFLRLGLRHAELCCKVAAKLTQGKPGSTLAEGKPELDTLIAFRRKHERSWVSNFNYCAWVEESSWVL